MVLRTPAPPASLSLDATVTLEVAGGRQRFKLLHPTRIGRSPNCHIRLGGASVHGEHVTLLMRGSSWMLEVAPFAPPVEINDVAVRSAMLRSGDVISIDGVQIEFQSTRHDRDSSPISTVPSIAPKDPTDPKRAWVTELAKRQSSLDIERAHLEAERDEWLIRLAAEKKLIDQQSGAFKQRMDAAEEKLKQARTSLLVEQRQSRLEADLQRQEITRVREALAEERVKLTRDQAEQARIWHEMKAEHDRQISDARGSRAAAVRMMQQLQTEKDQLAKRIEQVEAAESRLAQAQSRIERQVEIGSHELAGLQRRIDNERILLADLQRRRQLADRGPKITSQLAPSDASPSDVADLEVLATQLERALRHVEIGSREIEVADRRIREQELRLQHLARHLATEQDRLAKIKPADLTGKQDKLEKLSLQLDSRQAELDRKNDEFLAERTQWSIQRSAWEESQAGERTTIEKQRDRLRQQRWRLAVAHRQRLARIRQTRQQLKKDQERVLVRVAQLARQEARLEILKQEIGHLRLAQLEQQVERLRADDLLGSAAIEAQDKATQHRQFCEDQWARFEGRMKRTLEWLEGELLGAKTARRSASRPSEHTSDRWRVENASLATSQMERERAWNIERKKYQDELARLREELESMAAHLISPAPNSAA